MRRIAQGGMAEVYLARFTGVEGFERWVVIKKMLPELAIRKDFVEMFLDEARLAARFNHPNIVQVFELGEKDGSYFMAMEYVDGPHLGTLFAHSLRQKKPMPINLCAYIIARAAEGLHHAHELKESNGTHMQIVHRDVSPQNILVSRDADIKIMDFGVAKATTQANVTRTGVVKGKVGYMSPEQCLANPVDRRTDVFALGIVLYELVTRRRLFRDKSDLVVMQRITQDPIPPPSSMNPRVSAELDGVVMHALERDLSKRTQDALILSDELDGYLAGQNESVSRSTLSRWMRENAPESTGSEPATSQATPSWPQPGQSSEATETLGRRTPAPSTEVPRPEPPVLTEPTAVSDGDDTGEQAAAALLEQTPPMNVQPPGTRRALSLGLVAASLAGGALVLIVGGYTLFGGSGGGTQAQSSGGPAQTTDPTPPPPDPSTARSEPAPSSSTPAAAVLATTGALRVMTDPPGAEITVNKVARGRTGDAPVEVADLPVSAPASVVAMLPGFDVMRLDVPLVAGQVTTLPIIKLRKEAPVAKAAILDITSEPPGAKVIVDGKLLGKTPLSGVELAGGSHSVVVDGPPGYQTVRESLRAKAGERAPVHFVLPRSASSPTPQPSRDPGRIFIDSEPWTNIYLGNKLLGPTPLANFEVPSGRVVLRLVRKEGACSIEATRAIDVAPNGTTKKTFRIEPRENKGNCQ